MRWIDIHTHIGRLLHDREPLSPAALVAWMDEQGIDQAVVMAVEMPEEVDFYVTTEQVLDACAAYPDRLIPFCAVDPRRRYPGSFDPRPILREFVERGCRGFGEVLAGLPIDDPLMQAIYAACGELGLPITLHMDDYILRDAPGLPGLEHMLQQFPDTIFIGHAQHFWAEISREVDMAQLRGRYPDGPVVPGGATDRLLSEYPNLYGDLSARSGYNALTRDPAFGRAFLIRHQDKLLFGTDYLSPGQPTPIIELLRDPELPEEVRRKIGYANAERLLKL